MHVFNGSEQSKDGRRTEWVAHIRLHFEIGWLLVYDILETKQGVGCKPLVTCHQKLKKSDNFE